MSFRETVADLGGLPRLRGGGDIVEEAEGVRLAGELYAGLPLSSLGMPMHSVDSARIARIALSVPFVDDVRDFPKIGEAIVRRIAIQMVDFVLWPLASHHRPNDWMGESVFS